eukprot:422432-Pleurochrysis_carterae.AAC.3
MRPDEATVKHVRRASVKSHACSHVGGDRRAVGVVRIRDQRLCKEHAQIGETRVEGDGRCGRLERSCASA